MILVAITLLGGACGSDGLACVVPPCLAPRAVTIAVTSSATSGPVTGAFVQATGTTSPIPCDQSSCIVMGGAGTYELDVGAPGFQTVHRSVVVTERSSNCGCAEIDTQNLVVALVPSA